MKSIIYDWNDKLHDVPAHLLDSIYDIEKNYTTLTPLDDRLHRSYLVAGFTKQLLEIWGIMTDRVSLKQLLLK